MIQNLYEFAGVVCPDELYTLEAFKRRVGISDAALRAARRAGLTVSYIHKRAFVYGGDWIAYVRGHSHLPDQRSETPEGNSSSLDRNAR